MKDISKKILLKENVWYFVSFQFNYNSSVEQFNLLIQLSLLIIHCIIYSVYFNMFENRGY